MKVFFNFLSELPGVLVGENVSSHISMKQKKNKRCRKRSNPYLIMQKIRIDTHIDAINVNTLVGLNYLCNLIGSSFGIGLRGKCPPIQFQTSRHVQGGKSIDVVDVCGVTNRNDSLLLRFDYSASSLHGRVIYSKFKVRNRADFISLGLEQFFRKDIEDAAATNCTVDEENNNDMIGAMFLYKNTLFTVENINGFGRVHATAEDGNDNNSLDISLDTTTKTSK